MSNTRLYRLAASVMLTVAIGTSTWVAQPAEAKERRSATRSASSAAFEQALDKIIARENANVAELRKFRPVVETYIQNLQSDNDLGVAPASDEYYVGRVSFGKGVVQASMLPEGQKKGLLQKTVGAITNPLSKITGFAGTSFKAEGFAAVVAVDGEGFDRQHYKFEFVGREFLGEVRTIVIEVSPKKRAGGARFLGKIWVEDQNYNIVRFNGTYVPRPMNGFYPHFDTWRLNVKGDSWLPAYIYSEESDLPTSFGNHVHFKAQTRLWGYNTGRVNKTDEFSEIVVDSNDGVNDHSEEAQDLSPVAAQRAWERQAEDNALDRMERAGVLAKRGEVDKILETVINNLIVTNELNIQPEVRARVMLTSPIETFTVGHTIVVSRGLLDVLPDEASLAAVLSHELGHLALGHRINTGYAFSDRMFFNDEQTFRNLQFKHTPEEEQLADKRALEFMQKSPYAPKLANAGLFMRQLQDRQKTLPNLIRAQMGNSLTLRESSVRLNDLMNQAPKLEPKKLDQIAALPLGGRIKVDPWSDSIVMQKSKAVQLVLPNEKMPFEVTPMFPHLSRLSNVPAGDVNTQSSDSGAPASQPTQQIVPTNDEDAPRAVPAQALKVAANVGDIQ